MERKKELIVKTPDGAVENRYEVQWPTIQEMIDIESLKLSLSKGKYTTLVVSGTKWMDRVLNYIDMCSYLSVLCPKLVKDMKIDIRDLDAMDANKGLMIVYTKQFLPWWNDYEQMVDKFENPDPVEKDSKEDNSSDGTNSTDNDKGTA